MAQPRAGLFFPAAATVMVLIVAIGFMPSFYLRPWFRSAPLPGHLVAHAVIMTSWQLLFLAQTLLVATGRTGWHRRLGTAGVTLALAAVVAGVHAVLQRPAWYAEHGGAPPFPMVALVVGNALGFVAFGALVVLAVNCRRDMQTHRRLMYWACIVAIGPALTTGRMLGSLIAPYFPVTFPPEAAAVWLAWIALLAYDWRISHRFHPASIVPGILLLFVLPACAELLMRVPALTVWVDELATL